METGVDARVQTPAGSERFNATRPQARVLLGLFTGG
jgi:hypothetical protein